MGIMGLLKVSIKEGMISSTYLFSRYTGKTATT
jgi:hypothetical protein